MNDNDTGEGIEARPSEFEFPGVGSSSEHELLVDGKRLPIRAVAEWMTLRKIHKPVAHMFHTAYLADGQPPAARPLTFVFNGGPGAASAYLHMGALGPQRVAFGPAGSLPPPPTRLEENLETWLAFTDLVFIDPLGTGFSRAIRDEPAARRDPDRGGKGDPAESGPQENTEFSEVQRDLDSLGEFICRFLSKHHRWTSPLFVAGESYGGFRVAKMARRLQETHGVGLCGALLISPAIEFEGLFGSDYNLMHWIELFPSLVAAAHHHGAARGVDGEFDQVLADAEQFASDQLARWVTSGRSLSPPEREEMEGRMAAMTGLSASLVARAEGRISATMFCRELLRAERKLCGRYDASVTTIDPFPDRHDYAGPDPTLFSIERLFAGAINHHLRSHLGVQTELEYRLLSMQVNKDWKDRSNQQAFRGASGAMDDMRYGMSLNEHLRVFISHGYFDLITPYFSSRRLVDLMKLTDKQQQNLTIRSYLGGHMFYSWDASRIAFRDDAKAFYASSLPNTDQ